MQAKEVAPVIAKARAILGGEEGTTIVEYAMILAAACMACMAALSGVGAFAPVSYAFP